MAIENYTDLLSAIADFLNRDDLTARIPDFIRLAEAHMNRSIRHPSMRITATAALTAGQSERALPSDFAGVTTVALATTPPTPLEMRTPVALLNLQAVTSPSGQPVYCSLVGRILKVCPAADGAYTLNLTHYEAIPALGPSNTANWLLTAYPDAYLYGALFHAGTYLKDAEERTFVGEAFKTILAAIVADGEAQGG